MPRPRCQRRLGMLHGPQRFKPVGIPARMLDEVVLTLDELEALRLADLEGLYHDRAAERMGISRTTFGRILSEARKKVADALVGGKVLGIGEQPLSPGIWSFVCPTCGHRWEQPWPIPNDLACPHCGTRPEAWTPREHRPWGRRGGGGQGFQGSRGEGT